MGPLQDLVVVDLSRVVSGAIAGMILADHGADVIKVEPKGGSHFAQDLSRKSWDRGKLSVSLDLYDDIDLAKIIELAQTADILIHSLEPADAAKFGLDRAALARRNPELVVCALTAYGQDAPFRDRPYGESLAAARFGLMGTVISAHRGGPVYPGHPAMAYGQAFMAVINSLAALRVRRESGVGQGVESSLLDSAAVQSVMHWWQEGGTSFIGTADRGSPLRFGYQRLITGMYKAGDGKYLQFHTGGQGGFKLAMDVLGFGDRIKAVVGPDFATPLNEDEYQAARFELDDVFLKKDRGEWLRLFTEADVAALPVLPPAQVLLDEQVDFTGMRIELADPDFGKIQQAAPAVRFRNHPAGVPAPAPRIGQHDARLPELLSRERSHRPPVTSPPKRALDGIKIVDVGVFFACSFASRLLSDLGADVIKVEGLAGDQMRPLADLYDGAQRGKRNIALNLKTPEGREVLQKLIKKADIVIHNLRAGNAEKLGFGAAEMMAANPKLIYAFMPGYGSVGPRAKQKSFAPLHSGWTGMLYEGGGDGNPPARSVFGNEDTNNGLLGACALLMALEARSRSGKGDYVECPQLHSGLVSTSEHFLDADGDTVWGMRMDKAQQGFNALDRIYKSQDGWICISCRADDAFASLARAIGRPDLPQDPRFATSIARSSNDAELLRLLEDFFAPRSKQDAFGLLDSVGAPAEIVEEADQIGRLLHEEWPRKSGRVFEYRKSIAGHIKVFGLVSQLEDTPGTDKGPAAELGRNTDEILRELAYAELEIQQMKLARAVLSTPGVAE